MLLVFHGGFPKTATSFLQKKIFVPLDGLGSHSAIKGVSKLRLDLTKHFRPDLEIGRGGRSLSDCVLEIQRLSARSTIVYSDENLLLSPSWISNRKLGSSTTVGDLFAETLKELEDALGPDDELRTIITIRRQSQWLASYYAQISNRIHANQADFERRLQEFLSDEHTQGLPLLKYDQILKRLVHEFGSERVLMLPMEAMAEQRYWTELFRFMRVSNNKVPAWDWSPLNQRGYGQSAWKLRPRKLSWHNTLSDTAFLRSVAKLAERLSRRMLRVVRNRSIVLTPELEKLISSSYAASNAELQQSIPWDLKRLGYLPD